MATKEEILRKIDNVEHRIETAQKGVHNSQEWNEEWTGEYTPTGETYQDWIDSGLQELREMIQQAD